MLLKTGIDIIEVKRIEEGIEKYGEKFLNRVFTEKEIEYCESKKAQKFQSYAGRFAGKEAVFKAVSAYLDNKCQEINDIIAEKQEQLAVLVISSYSLNSQPSSHIDKLLILLLYSSCLSFKHLSVPVSLLRV